MYYIYPKLSKYDLEILRIGGAGLGNILFPYARAVVQATKDKNAKLIWPTWPSIKIGPFLRREKDKRTYMDLFKNNSNYIHGIKKTIILATHKKISEKQFNYKSNVQNGQVVIFEDFDDWFEPILGDSRIVFENICINLKGKNRKALNFDARKAICVHVRLGDFNKPTINNLTGGSGNALPIDWYISMVTQVRKIVGQEIKVYVFSDGTDEELEDLIKLKNVERKTFGTSIADIIALSRAGLFIASKSTFSMWARYFGRMTTVLYPNKYEQKLLLDNENTKEIFVKDLIDSSYYEHIKNIFI